MDAYPDSKVPGANMEPIWGRQGPGWPHVGHMNFVIWVKSLQQQLNSAIFRYVMYLGKLLHKKYLMNREMEMETRQME